MQKLQNYTSVYGREKGEIEMLKMSNFFGIYFEIVLL